MALDWVTRTNYDPPMIGACVNKNNASSSAILDTKEFSVNVPSVDMLEVTDYTGLVSGKRVDKSAPMIKKCPLNIECWLAEPVELPTNCFFIAEIINIYSSEKFLSDGKPDVQKIRHFVLTMPDNRFWEIGECVGKAWDAGKVLRKRD